MIGAFCNLCINEYIEPPNQPQPTEILQATEGLELDEFQHYRGYPPDKDKEYTELPNQPNLPETSEPIRQPELRPCYHIIEDGKLIRKSGMPS